MTFFKGGIAEEQVVAASSRCCLTAVGFHDLVECVTDLLHLVVECHYSLLEELVTWHILTNVEV